MSIYLFNLISQLQSFYQSIHFYFHPVNHNRCPGAVLLLPLLDMHLSHLCQALEARGEASGSASERRPATTAPGRLDEVDAVSLEDTGLAALRILYMLINHSDEVC